MNFVKYTSNNNAFEEGEIFAKTLTGGKRWLVREISSTDEGYTVAEVILNIDWFTDDEVEEAKLEHREVGLYDEMVAMDIYEYYTKFEHHPILSEKITLNSYNADEIMEVAELVGGVEVVEGRANVVEAEKEVLEVADITDFNELLLAEERDEMHVVVDFMKIVLEKGEYDKVLKYSKMLGRLEKRILERLEKEEKKRIERSTTNKATRSASTGRVRVDRVKRREM